LILCSFLLGLCCRVLPNWEPGRCCVSDMGECEDWADGGWPWLEAGGEFVEGGANPIMQGQLGRKLVVAASQVLYEGVPG
jgi:hypothetical protein